MRVIETGDNKVALKINDSGVGALMLQNIVFTADRNDSICFDGQCRRATDNVEGGRAHDTGVDIPVDVNRVGHDQWTLSLRHGTRNN